MIAVYSLEDGSNVEYKISEFMLTHSSLFKTFFESSGDTQIHLEMFKEEFLTINNGSLDLLKYKTVEEINYIYEVLGYFGVDCLLKKLNEHVYYLEMTNESIVPHTDLLKVFTEKVGQQICGNPKLSEDFFENRISLLHEDWSELSQNPGMSEAFFDKHILEGNVNWYNLCRNKGMSEEFFEKYIPTGKINWLSLSGNTNMSEAFFERHVPSGNIIWWKLCSNTNMSEVFFEKYVHTGKLKWVHLCENTNISEAFFEKYIPIGEIHWNQLSGNSNMSEEFFERHLDMVNWTYLSGNTNMSEAFFERHIPSGNIVWASLCKNPNLSESFFERHISKINKYWYYIFREDNISEQFIIRNLQIASESATKFEKDTINLSICRNRKLPTEFLEKFILQIFQNDQKTIDMPEYWDSIIWSNVSLEFVFKHCPLALFKNRGYNRIDLIKRKDKYRYKDWLNLVN